MPQAGFSTSVYFLRFKKVKYHALEPYASIGLTFQRNTYRGNYLATDQNNNPVQSNYSNSDDQLLGRTTHENCNFSKNCSKALGETLHSNLNFLTTVAPTAFLFCVISCNQNNSVSFNGVNLYAHLKNSTANLLVSTR
jgi:hypothetical protein